MLEDDEIEAFIPQPAQAHHYCGKGEAIVWVLSRNQREICDAEDAIFSADEDEVRRQLQERYQCREGYARIRRRSAAGPHGHNEYIVLPNPWAKQDVSKQWLTEEAKRMGPVKVKCRPDCFDLAYNGDRYEIDEDLELVFDADNGEVSYDPKKAKRLIWRSNYRNRKSTEKTNKEWAMQWLHGLLVQSKTAIKHLVKKEFPKRAYGYVTAIGLKESVRKHITDDEDGCKTLFRRLSLLRILGINPMEAWTREIGYTHIWEGIGDDQLMRHEPWLPKEPDSIYRRWLHLAAEKRRQERHARESQKSQDEQE